MALNDIDDREHVMNLIFAGMKSCHAGRNCWVRSSNGEIDAE